MKRHHAAATLAVLALLTWGRVVLIDSLRDQGYFAKYPLFADQILAGHIPHERLGDLSPLYLWLTVLFRKLHMDLHAIRTTQVIVLSIGVLLCAIAAKRIGGWIAAFATAFLILGNRAALVVASDLEPETVIFVLVSAAIVFLVSEKRVWLGGLFLGLAAIARPVFLLALVLIAVWLFFRSKRDAIKLTAAGLVPVAIIVIVNLSLIGNAILMQPGTVFYEGNNPLSTGCAGVMPKIVAEMNAQSPEPDYLHVAYRIIAARATGKPVSARLSNQYWTSKSLEWIRSAPGAALRLWVWKAWLSIHNYDAYDLRTTKRKADELAHFPSIPFGLVIALACCSRKKVLLLVLLALSTFVALVMFNVTARQRNALLPPMAVMAGAGAAEIAARARAKDRRAGIALGGVLAATLVLSIEGSVQREDRYNWRATFEAEELRRAAGLARDRVRAAELASLASIVDTGAPPTVSMHNLREVALAYAPRTTQPEERFDLAIALVKAGACREADAILATLGDYHPHRETRAVSSIAYYRARCGGDVQQAMREAPGDPDVLALAATRGDLHARELLDRLHDPFTRDRALSGLRRPQSPLSDTHSR
ncbi:MAG TPA: hypothetical protein VMU84_08030 [Thermoanaerobaculia bacterium]|nr:hypothetical protein [Thermoanaerobaculia bacterium]